GFATKELAVAQATFHPGLPLCHPPDSRGQRLAPLEPLGGGTMVAPGGALLWLTARATFACATRGGEPSPTSATVELRKGEEDGEEHQLLRYLCAADRGPAIPCRRARQPARQGRVALREIRRDE